VGARTSVGPRDRAIRCYECGRMKSVKRGPLAHSLAKRGRIWSQRPRGSESPPSNSQNYHVGWICVGQTEYVVACELLDPRCEVRLTDLRLAGAAFYNYASTSNQASNSALLHTGFVVSPMAVISQ
jgi:hypothetical protein